MKVCAIADVHCDTGLVTPPADILTVSGDLTMRGSIEELAAFRSWLVQQPQKHKIVIAGNHDFCFDNSKRAEAETIMGGDGIIYLRDELVEVEGLRIYGSPWQPWYGGWAFNLPRGAEIAEKWAKIPENLDILLVHGPPHGFGDLTTRGNRAGCEDLLARLEIVKPKYTCFGHIHEDYGQWTRPYGKFINCSVGYEVGWYDDASNRVPVVFEI